MLLGVVIIAKYRNFTKAAFKEVLKLSFVKSRCEMHCEIVSF